MYSNSKDHNINAERVPLHIANPNITVYTEKDNITKWQVYTVGRVPIEFTYEDLIDMRFGPELFGSSWIRDVCDLRSVKEFQSDLKILHRTLVTMDIVPDIVYAKSLDNTFKDAFKLSEHDLREASKATEDDIANISSTSIYPVCIVKGYRQDVVTGDVDIYVMNSIASALHIPYAHEAYDYVSQQNSYRNRDGLLKLLNDIHYLRFTNEYNNLVRALVRECKNIVGIDGPLIYVKSGAEPPIPVGNRPEHSTFLTTHDVNSANLMADLKRARYQLVSISKPTYYLRVEDKPWTITNVRGQGLLVTEDSIQLLFSTPPKSLRVNLRLELMLRVVEFIDARTEYVPNRYEYQNRLRHSIDVYTKLLNRHVKMIKTDNIDEDEFEVFFASIDPKDIGWSRIMRLAIEQYSPL